MHCISSRVDLLLLLHISHDNIGGESMGKKGMSKSAASRIQSHSAKSGRNQGFASRAQSAADKGGSKKR